MEFTFEEMCKEYLLYCIDPLPIELNQISRWSRTDHQTKKQVQIDIVGMPTDGYEYIICSCKYRNEKIRLDELVTLVTLENMY